MLAIVKLSGAAFTSATTVTAPSGGSLGANPANASVKLITLAGAPADGDTFSFVFDGNTATFTDPVDSTMTMPIRRQP